MIDGHWFAVRDADDRARALFYRHYSSDRSDKTRRGKFVGPGEYMALMTIDCQALFVWRYEVYRMDEQVGINCTIFRNEGATLSSALISEADELAWERWPGMRHFTFIDTAKVRRKRDPGRCFIRAGWRVCGRSKERDLLILERLAP